MRATSSRRSGVILWRVRFRRPRARLASEIEHYRRQQALFLLAEVMDDMAVPEGQERRGGLGECGRSGWGALRGLHQAARLHQALMMVRR